MKPITKTDLTKKLREQPGIAGDAARRVATQLLELGERTRKQLQRGVQPVRTVSTAKALAKRHGLQLLDLNGFNGWVLGVRFRYPPANQGLRPTFMLARDINLTAQRTR